VGQKMLEFVIFATVMVRLKMSVEMDCGKQFFFLLYRFVMPQS
jgi:hypothetical protein